MAKVSDEEDRRAGGPGEQSGTISRRQMLSGLTAAGVLAGMPVSARAGTTRAAGWDVIVVGAGVFGAWTAWNLQRRGKNVLLVDAWGAAHARASSGGETRLIRTEYGGDPLYTRWAWESLAEWRSLSSRCGSPVFQEVGALYIYPDDVPQIDQSVAVQRSLGIPIEKLDVVEMRKRWPQIDFRGITVGVVQPTMGALMARRGVQALVRDFEESGGSFRQTAVAPPLAKNGTLDSIAGDGMSLHAVQYVFSCGPWLPKLFPEVVGDRIVPSRQDVFFFAPDAGDVRFDGAHLPAWVDMSSKDLHYGFPDLESRGFKVALDVHGPRIDPDSMDRRVSDQALADVRAFLARRFPALADRPLAESRVCQYENTDNGDLLIDRHPEWPNVWLVGGGSGHGFKHGPAVGRYVADLLVGAGKAEPRLALAAHGAHGGARSSIGGG